MTAQEQSQTNKKPTNCRLTVAACIYIPYSVVIFSPVCHSGSWEDPYSLFVKFAQPPQAPILPSGKSHPQRGHAALEQLWTKRGHTDQPRRLRAGCLAQPWHSGLGTHPLHSYSTQAQRPSLWDLGHLPGSWKFKAGAHLLPFGTAQKFLGRRRQIWTCDSPAFGWDVAHAETVADFNCYVYVENKQILLKSCLNLKKSDLYFLGLTLMLAAIV